MPKGSEKAKESPTYPSGTLQCATAAQCYNTAISSEACTFNLFLLMFASKFKLVIVPSSFLSFFYIVAHKKEKVNSLLINFSTFCIFGIMSLKYSINVNIDLQKLV